MPSSLADADLDCRVRCSLHPSENFIDLLTHLLTPRRLQVAHRRFHVRMTEPLLHSAKIDACPETPSCERRSELVEPEVFRVLFRTLGDGLQIIEEVHLYVAPGSRKDQVACLVRLRLQRLEAGHQLCRTRNFSLCITLGSHASRWLLAY